MGLLACRNTGASCDSEGRGEGSGGGAKRGTQPLTAGAINDSPASYSLAGGAALVVRFGLFEVAGVGLHHVQPNVHYEPSTRTACVFGGHLANLGGYPALLPCQYAMRC